MSLLLARPSGALARAVRRHSRLLPRANASSSLPSLTFPSPLPALAPYAPCRGLASASRDHDGGSDGKEAVAAAGSGGGDVMVYEAPMGRSVRLMKRVSLTSCLLTSVGMPTVTFLSEQSASVVAKWAMCGTIMLFGVGTTSLFHLLFKPYVMRMWLAPISDHAGDADAVNDDARVTVETLTLLAGLTKSSFLLSEVARPEPSMHPMLSFQARGTNYFIHPECFEDDALLKKLLGADYKRPVRVKDDEDDA